MRGDESIGSRSCNNIHYSSIRINDNDESYEEEVIVVYLGEESRGHMSLETSHYYSNNCGGREICGHRSQETSNSTQNNHGGHGRWSSLTSHSSSLNCAGYVDRGGFRSK